MLLNNSRGFIPLILSIILLVSGIVIGSFLIKNPQIFSPKASSGPDISFESHYNPFGNPWSAKQYNPDIPVALTTGCFRRGPKLNSDPSVDQNEIDYLAKSNIPVVFEECAYLMGPNPQSTSNKQRLINIGTKLKQTNPDSKYIGYHVFWDVNFDGDMGSDIYSGAESDQNCGSVKCESFFVHKKGLPATKANRITGGRTLDITNPYFRQYIIPKVAQALIDMNMDGFLADGVGSTIPGASMAEIPDNIAASWGAAWADLFRDVKAAIGPNKLVFANSGGKGVDFSRTLIAPEPSTGKPRADGIMWEDPLGPLGLDMNSSGRLSELSAMYDTTSGLGKYLLTVVNTNVNCSNASGQARDYCFNQTNKQQEAAYAKYYLAAHLNLFKSNKNIMIYYTPLTTSPQFDAETYFRDWDLRIGKPTSEMQQVSPGVFLRTFQKARVYFNNSSGGYTGSGNGLFKLDGSSATNESVPAKSGAIFVTKQVLQEWNSAGTTNPSQGPTQTISTSAVSKLESTAKANYLNYFYTSKGNEITFLLNRPWRRVSGSAFYSPVAATPDAQPVYRFYKLDSQNSIQIATWALDQADRNRLKSLGFTEYDENDFYAYSTPHPGAIGVTRMKFFSSTYNQTFYQFATNASEISSLMQKGWSVDMSNAFYVYDIASPVVSAPSPSATPSPSVTTSPVQPVQGKPNILTSKSSTYCSGITPLVHIEWDNVPNTVIYKVFRGTIEPGSGIKVGETSGVGMNDMVVVPGVEYTYTVEADLSGGAEIYGSGFTVRPVSCSTPIPTFTPAPVQKLAVKRLEHSVRSGYYEKFFTTKANEITFLKSRGWNEAGTAFNTPVYGSPDAFMAVRMYLTDTALGAQIRTWAIDQSDINSLKAVGLLESRDSDFYAYLTQKPGTVGVTRMKLYSGAYNQTFYTFAASSSEVNTLLSQGWSVAKTNVFYVYP